MATAQPITPPPATPRRDPSPRLWTPAEFERMRDLGVFNGHAVELVAGTVLHIDDSRPVTFTQTVFCKLWDANFFGDNRVQLLGGEILQESFMNPPHALGLRKAQRTLERIFSEGHDVRCQVPVDMTPESRPHPDVAVVVGAMEDFAERHPTAAETVLVVEVSESTFESDTHEKMSLYAAAGVKDYWVIDTTGRVLVFRDPRPEGGQPFGHAYGRVTAHGRDDVISPLAKPDARINVADLLP